jgi:ubiquinone/menaquinone biosynthesis C-methylase UbiE
MPIIKCKTYIDVYRSKANSKDLNELSGRPGRPDLTDFVNQQIIKKMNLGNDDVVIDIGCGDGTLLKQAAKVIKQGFGVVPTDEEVDRVRSDLNGQHANIEIVKGSVQSVPLPTGLGSKIVCNGVILLINKNEIEPALGEIGRVSHSGAVVFIGEIPSKNEFENRSYGDSITKWLIWVAKNNGMKEFSKNLFQVCCSIITSEPFIIAPKKHYYSHPDDFINLAEKCGLIYQHSFVHKEITRNGKEKDHANRYNYVFKASGR